MNETNARGSGSARSAEIVPFRITIPEGLKDMTYASWRPSPRRPPPSGTVEASGRNPSRRGRGRSHRPRPPDVHRRAGGPCWARPALWAVLVLATALYAWNLSSLSGNTFHNAAIYSGTQSWKAFSFGALTRVRGASDLPIPRAQRLWSAGRARSALGSERARRIRSGDPESDGSCCPSMAVTLPGVRIGLVAG